MTKILLDMNYPEFQKQLFDLDKIEQRIFERSLAHLSGLITADTVVWFKLLICVIKISIK